MNRLQSLFRRPQATRVAAVAAKKPTPLPNAMLAFVAGGLPRVSEPLENVVGEAPLPRVS